MKYTLIDPPSGWLYGFPKRVPDEYLKSQTLMKMWFMSQGYPSKDIELALKHSRYWTVEEEK